MSSSNYYDVLGIPKDSNETEIKSTYRKLSRKWHPDRNTSTEATEKFQKINEAYETLSDSNKRKMYDNELNGVRMPQGFPMGRGGGHPFPFTDMHDIFKTFNSMGGMGGHQSSFTTEEIHIVNGRPVHIRRSSNTLQKPPPIIKNVNISFEQSYLGCRNTISLERWVINDDDGNTKTNETENIILDIPSGVENEEIMIIREKGNKNKSLCGDLKLIIKIENTTDFRREGLHLLYTKKISLKEALCGIQYLITLFNGKRFIVKEDEIIKPGNKKVMPSLGFTRLNSTGDIIVSYEIIFPDNLDEYQKITLGEILD